MHALIWKGSSDLGGEAIETKEREKLFCYYYAKLQNPREAALKAGYPLQTADKNAAKLLARQDIAKQINKCSESEKKSHLRQKLLSGVLRLSFGSINDVVKLVLRQDELTDQVIDQLDFFSVSELKKQRDGGFEIKFFDRLQALEKLEDILSREEQTDTASEFYHILASSAADLQRDSCEETEEEKDDTV